jgi:hypothetical protein
MQNGILHTEQPQFVLDGLLRRCQPLLSSLNFIIVLVDRSASGLQAPWYSIAVIRLAFKQAEQ